MVEVSMYERLDDTKVMIKVKWTQKTSDGFIDGFIVVFVKVSAGTSEINSETLTVPSNIQKLAIDQARELAKEFFKATEKDIP